MANDPNNSGNRRPPNTLADLGASKMPSSINRILENVSPAETQRYQWLREQQANIENDRLYDLGSRNPMLMTDPNAAKQFGSLQNRRASYIRQQEIMEEAAAARANRMVGTTVNQSFSGSTINGQISARLESTDAQQRALRIASTVDPDNLSRRIRMSESRMTGYAEEASKLKTVNRFGDPDPAAQERLQQLYGLREVELNRRSGMMGAARIHRMQGLDPESRMDSLVRSVDQAGNITGRQSPEVQKLMGLSSGDFRKQEFEAADRLARSFEKLSQVADTTSDEFKNLKKEVDDAEKTFKDVQNAKASGAGGGGGISGWALAQGGFEAAAMGIQQIGVNQRLGGMSNTAGFANFQNQAYQTYKAANAGDVASLMMLPQFQAAEGFGGSLGTAANAAVISRGAAGVMQVGAGGVQAASTVNVLSDVLNSSGAAGAMKAGGQDVIAGTAVTLEAGMDYKRQISAGQANVAGRNARIEVARAIQAIGAEQLQGFRDFGVGMGGAAGGMGLGGDAFLRSTVTASQLDRLSAARISPTQFAELAGQGVNSMGSGFNQEQIFGARALERRGLGNAGQNMERMSQLYAAGANNPQEGLGRILEAAIPKGFDNSKLVGQLVQYTSQVAQNAGGAASGLNLTGAAATLLTSGINPSTQNKEAMLQHAADLQGAFKGVETNTSTSYAGMVSVARAQRSMGRGGVSAVIAESLPTEVLMGLRDEADPAKRKAALMQQGLSPSTQPGTLDKLIENRQMKELEAGGAGFVVNAKGGLSGLLGRMRKGGQLNDQDMESVGQIAALERINTGADVKTSDIISRISGTGTKGTTGTGAGVFSDKDVGKLQKSMDDLRTQGFVQLSSAAAAAAKSLDPLVKSTGAIEKLAAAFKSVEGTITNVEKEAGTAAARGSAGGKGFDTTQWDAAAKKLNTILDRIITKQGGAPVPTQKPEVPQ